MKKLFFIIGLFFSLSAMAQPTNYTKINMRYRWLSGMFDSALYVPRYNGTPSGVRVNETSVFDGMIAMDTTNNRLYIYSGGGWIRLANYSEIAAYTAGNGLTLSGSQFQLGGALSRQTIVSGSWLLGLTSDTVAIGNSGTDITVNSASGDITLNSPNGKYYMVLPESGSATDSVLTWESATNQVKKRNVSSLVSTPTLQQVLTAGSTLTTNHTIDFGGNDLKIKGDSLQIVNTDGDVRIKLIPSAGGVGSAATRLTFINADAAEMFIQSGDEHLETYSGWYIRNEIGNNPALSVNGKTGGQTAPYIEVLQGAEKLFEIDADSFSINPPLGVLNIDSLRTWSGIADTTYKKPMTWDTRNGRWEYAANWYGGGGGTPALQQVLTAGSNVSNPVDIRFNWNELNVIQTSDFDRIFTFSDDDAIYIDNLNNGQSNISINTNDIEIYRALGGREPLGGRESTVKVTADSIILKPNEGQLNIDSLRTWSGISDTTYKKPMTWDTRNGRWEYAANWPQQKINLVFGAGSGADADTTAFTTTALYGDYYTTDTIKVTSLRIVMQGTSPSVTVKIFYNDSLGVQAGATALVTAGNAVTNTTTGTNITSFDVSTIPPNVYVWAVTSTVGTKPKYLSIQLNGYRK